MSEQIEWGPALKGTGEPFAGYREGEEWQYYHDTWYSPSGSPLFDWDTKYRFRPQSGVYKAQGGWIEWHGGECPVPDDTVVQVKVHGGHEYGITSAGEFGWSGDFGAYSITAYRIVKQAEPLPDAHHEPASYPMQKTLWDDYAIAALSGFCSGHDSTGMRSWIAEDAVSEACKIADLMMKARET